MSFNLPKCSTCEFGGTWDELAETAVPFLEKIDTQTGGLVDLFVQMKEAAEKELPTHVRSEVDQKTAHAEEVTFGYMGEAVSIVSRVTTALDTAGNIDCAEVQREDPTVRCPRLAYLMPVLLSTGEEAQRASARLWG